MKKKDQGTENKYHQNPAISNSALGWLDISPRMFVARVNKEIGGDESKSLDLGSLTHILLLEPERLDEYSIMPEGLVTPSSPQQKEICTTIIENSMSVREGLGHLYPKYYSTEKKSKKVIDSAIDTLYKKLSPYIDFMIASEGKIIIPHSLFQEAVNCEANVIQHKKANKLLFHGEESYNELEIYFKINYPITDKDDKEIECKSKIDRLVIDHKNKEVSLIDVKTTSKIGNYFGKSVEFYNYDRQLAFYKRAVESYLKKHKLEDYKILIYFVVVETIGFNEVYVYRVNDDIIKRGKEKYNNLLDRLVFHMENGFDYSKEYYEGDGSIELKLE